MGRFAERCDWGSLKTCAWIALWLAWIAEAIWVGIELFHLHTPVSAIPYPLVFLSICFLLGITRGRIHWIAFVMRIVVGLAFLEALADRFGLLGPPGTPGVAWGNFSRFVAYTGRVNSFLPHSVIPELAVVATIFEFLFGFTMLLGIRARQASLGSAILLCLFGTAMTISGLTQFSYGVYLLAAGALVLATVDPSIFSVDSLLRRRNNALRPRSQHDDHDTIGA